MALLRTAAGILRTARRFSSTSLLLCAPAALRGLSAVSSKPQLTSDSELLSLLDKTINRAAEHLKPSRQQIKLAPLFLPYVIHDGSGSQIIILTRENEDEHIEVRVKIPEYINVNNVEGRVEIPDYINGYNVEKKEDDEILKLLRTSVAIAVTVSKDSGASLTFSCTVYPDEIVINHVTARIADADDIEMFYEGPEFKDLDENLQKGFLKYLEMRDITTANCCFLFYYMMAKDKKEYHLWLRKVKEFLRRDGDLAAQSCTSEHSVSLIRAFLRSSEKK